MSLLLSLQLAALRSSVDWPLIAVWLGVRAQLIKSPRRFAASRFKGVGSHEGLNGSSSLFPIGQRLVGSCRVSS